MVELLSSSDCFKKYGSPELEKGMTLWDVPKELEIGVTVKLDSIPSVGSVLFDCFRSTWYGGEGFQLYVYSSGAISFYHKITHWMK